MFAKCRLPFSSHNQCHELAPCVGLLDPSVITVFNILNSLCTFNIFNRLQTKRTHFLFVTKLQSQNTMFGRLVRHISSLSVTRNSKQLTQ